MNSQPPRPTLLNHHRSHVMTQNQRPTPVSPLSYPIHTSSRPQTYFNNDIFLPRKTENELQREQQRKEAIARLVEHTYGPNPKITQAQYDHMASLVDAQERQLQNDRSRTVHEEARPEWLKQNTTECKSQHLLWFIRGLSFAFLCSDNATCSDPDTVKHECWRSRLRIRSLSQSQPPKLASCFESILVFIGTSWRRYAVCSARRSASFTRIYIAAVFAILSFRSWARPTSAELHLRHLKLPTGLYLTLIPLHDGFPFLETNPHIAKSRQS